MIRHAPLLLAVVAVGCSSDRTTAPPHPATSAHATSASNSAVAASTAPPTAASSGPRRPATSQTRADKHAVAKHLAAGRKLAASKDWKAAMGEFEAALATSPSDARVLAELGWAAFHAGDLDKAKDANKRALAAATDPTRRAQILYNTGRVAEEEKDNEAAKAAYGESLGLRDNKEVAKHFEAVGGKSDEIARASTPCGEGFDSLKELCACLVEKAADFMILGDANPKCEADPAPPPLGDARLSLIHMRADEGREDTHVLAARDGKKMRAVAVLGTSYEPGAFGVHNEHSIKSAEAKQVGGRSIVVVHHLEDDNDTNMAGLELCTNKVAHDTLCVLGQSDGPTRCPITIPVSASSGCGPGVEPDPDDVSDDEKELIAQIKASATRVEARTSYVLGDDGKLTVKLESGDAKALPPKALGEFVLFTK